MARLERALSGSTLSKSWRDRSGQTHRVEADFDPGWLEDPAARRALVDWNRVASEVEAAAREWASARGFSLSVTANRGASGLEYRCTGMRLPEQGEIDAYLDQLIAQVVGEQGFLSEKPEGFSPDVRRAAVRAAPYLNPLVRALRSERQFLEPAKYVAKALSFVQLIPYVANTEDFLLPAGVLFEDRGDCDEKAALLLGLFWAVYPRQPAVEVRIPRHLMIGFCDLNAPSTISAFGRQWAGCEAAGPAQLPLGEVSPEVASALRAGTASIRELRFGKS